MIGLRYLRLSFRLLFKKSPNLQIDNSNSVACFDGSIKAVKSRKEYLENLTNPNPVIWIGRDSLGYGKLNWFSATTFFFASLLLIIYLPHLLFAKNRASYALLLLEYCEWCILMKLLQTHKIQKVYFFCSFELDGNFIGYLLKKAAVKTVRIPSSTPLSNFYKKVVGDIFAFTAPFHLEEYELHKKNWFINKTINFPCFNYPELLNLESNQSGPNRSETEMSIGVLTRGIWRRRERGDIPNDIGEYLSEEELLDALRLATREIPELKISILLHPCEKETPQLLERAKYHYRNIIKSGNVDFPDPSKGSLEHFYDFNVGISTHSSANVERLFLGLKTLYFPSQISSPLYSKTKIKNICCFTSEDLISNLTEALQQKNSEFFKSRQIEEYVHFGTEKLSGH